MSDLRTMHDIASLTAIHAKLEATLDMLREVQAATAHCTETWGKVLDARMEVANCSGRIEGWLKHIRQETV